MKAGERSASPCFRRSRSCRCSSRSLPGPPTGGPWRRAPNGLLVSLRALDAGGRYVIVLHPLGALEISQNVVPLDVTLDRVGEQIPSDANSVSLDVTGGAFIELRDAVRSFAPAEFRNMSDADRLSAPAFQDLPSGVVRARPGRIGAPAMR